MGAGPVDPAALRAAARAGRRREQRRAALLVAPLFVFLLLTFVGPIGSLLWRGVTDSEVAGVLPRTTAALGAWSGEGLPADSTFAALIEDMREAYAAGTLAPAATRLNYDVNGFRTLMFGTARRLRDAGAGNRCTGGAYILETAVGATATPGTAGIGHGRDRNGSTSAAELLRVSAFGRM